MTKSTAKRHHFVPQFILRRFCDEQGMLHVYRKDQSKLGVRASRPENVFFKRHLYSEKRKDGTNDPSFEANLCALEGRASIVIERIITAARNNTTPDLTNEEQETWFEFMYMQWKRVPDLHKTMNSDEEVGNNIDKKLDWIIRTTPQRRTEAELLRHPVARRRLIQNIRVDVYRRRGDEVIKVLQSRGIAVIRITRPNKQFIIGSRPVVKLTVDGKSDLRDPQTEMWLPVAPDIALGVGSGKGSIRFYALHSERAIRQLNMACAHQSSTFAGASARLVQSLAGAR